MATGGTDVKEESKKQTEEREKWSEISVTAQTLHW